MPLRDIDDLENRRAVQSQVIGNLRRIMAVLLFYSDPKYCRMEN